MRYLSLFTGIGGFELGIFQAYESHTEHAFVGEESEQKERQQGGKRSSDKHGILLHDRNRSAPLCVGYSEVDKYAVQVYEKHFPKHRNFGDITRIVPEELPDFDLVVGGFPCQAFSIAGKRGGFSDTRGTLFFDIARILRVKKPRYLLLENVKGLLSHDGGKTFDTIIRTLDELGYDVQWQVLNSKNFGVPQNRERVFIVGHLRGTGRPKVFPIGDGHSLSFEQSQISATLDSNYGKRANWNRTFIKELVGGSQGSRVYDPSGLSTTLASQAGGLGAKTGLYAVRDLTPENAKEFPTIRSGGDGGVPSQRLLQDMKIRRLTPMECERLQGFPDNWTQGLSDTQRYKTLGNAVTVNVVKEVALRLIL